jgi:toxin ParE1/3/4
VRRFSVVFTPRAERQLAKLYADIRDDSGERQAEKFVGALVADCLALSSFPERGAKRDDIRPNLRVKGYARRVSIAFSVNPKAAVVAIHGIYYGGQNLERALRESGDD